MHSNFPSKFWQYNCKFLDKGDYGCSKCQFCFNFAKLRDFSRHFVFFDKNFLTRKRFFDNFSTAQNLRERQLFLLRRHWPALVSLLQPKFHYADFHRASPRVKSWTQTISTCRDVCDSPWQVCNKPVCVALMEFSPLQCTEKVGVMEFGLYCARRDRYLFAYYSANCMCRPTMCPTNTYLISSSIIIISIIIVSSSSIRHHYAYLYLRHALYLLLCWGLVLGYSIIAIGNGVDQLSILGARTRRRRRRVKLEIGTARAGMWGTVR